MLRLYLYVKRCVLKTLILGGGSEFPSEFLPRSGYQDLLLYYVQAKAILPTQLASHELKRVR